MASVLRIVFVMGLLITECFERLLAAFSLNNLKNERTGNEREKLPPVFTDEKLDSIQAYSAANNRYAAVSSGFDILITLIFILTGLFGWSVRFSASLTSFPALNGLILVLVLNAADSVLKIPFSLYKTFKLEASFGFNKQTKKGWVRDFWLGLIVGSVMQSIIVIPLFYLAHTYQTWWWIPAYIVTALIEMFLMYLYPVLIAPLFNRFEPLENETLKQRLISICDKAGITVEGIFQMDGSRRSTHANAYFTGMGKSKRIVLYDTLIKDMTEGEIEAVFAHEAGHWRRKHILKGLALYLLLTLGVFYGISVLIHYTPLYEAFFVQYNPQALYAGFLIIAQAFQILFFPASPFFSSIQRKYEYEADAEACGLSEGENLKKALIKLTEKNLGNPFPHPLDVMWNYSHPPLLQRLRRLT